MRWTIVWIALLVTGALAGPVEAKKAKAPTAEAKAATVRAMGELGGKFKWGMKSEECIKILAGQLHEKYADLLKKEPDVYKQDLIRKEEQEEIEKVRNSLTKFTGQKSGWDTSIVDKEFVQRNDESMLVMWERDQRRFLFFWHDKLVKQYIAFNAEHPAFKGKSFDDFVQILQNRYGQAEMKMAALRTKDDVTLDHMEWPPAGDFILWAVDQSGFYGNYCLKLMQTSTLAALEKARTEHSPKQSNRNAIIDAVTAPDGVKGDPNADIVDQIVGKGKATGTAPAASP